MTGFVNSNDYLDGRKVVPTTEEAGEVLSCRFTLAMTTADLTINYIDAIGVLPARCVPLFAVVDGTDLDASTAALVLQFGILDAAGTAFSTAAGDGGAAWASSANTGTDAAFIQELLSVAMQSVVASDVDRLIGMKIVTAPTTPAAGTIGLRLYYQTV